MTGSFIVRSAPGKETKIVLAGDSEPWEGTDQQMVDELNDLVPAAHDEGDVMRFLKGVAHCKAVMVYPNGYPAYVPDWTKRRAVSVKLVQPLPL
jgi:hypothetical protein